MLIIRRSNLHYTASGIITSIYIYIFVRFLVRISASSSVISESFCGLIKSLHAYIGILLQLGHERFFSQSFPKLSVIVRRSELRVTDGAVKRDRIKVPLILFCEVTQPHIKLNNVVIKTP